MSPLFLLLLLLLVVLPGLFPLVAVEVYGQEPDFSEQPTEEEVKSLAVQWFSFVKGGAKLIGQTFITMVRLFTAGNVDVPPQLVQGITFAAMTIVPALVIFTFVNKVISHGSKWILIVLLGIFALINVPALSPDLFNNLPI